MCRVPEYYCISNLRIYGVAGAYHATLQKKDLETILIPVFSVLLPYKIRKYGLIVDETINESFTK